MNNIPGWFPKENQATLEALIKEHNVQTVIEIGAFVGLSTVFFAQRVRNVTTVDPFDAITRVNYLNGQMKRIAQDQFDHFMRNTTGYSNITSLVATSQEAAAGPLKDKTADLIYIDGSHEYADVKLDIELWYLRANKILCGDDYSPHWPGVRQAVDELDGDVNRNQRLWYILK